jgi:chemotaxis protein MotB
MIAEDPPPGVPEWVVTYGDMMSLLLTFFIMLVSLSEVKANKRFRAVLESLQQTMGYRAGPAVPPGENFPLNSFVGRLETLGSFSRKNLGRGGVKTPQTVEGDDLRVHLPRQGKPVPAGELLLFDHDSAELTAVARSKIQAIAEMLVGKPNKVEIRGHTAPSPLPQTDPEQLRAMLDLSFQRAKAVAVLLEAAGVSSQRLRMVAVGDHEPLPSGPKSSSLRNDRVEVLILDAFAQDFVGPSR